MGDARQRSGQPWWVPVVGFLAIFGAFVWIARTPSEADSALGAAASLPRTLAEAALVRRPSDGSASRIVLLLHGSGSSPENFLTVAEEIGGHGFVAIAVRGPRELGPSRYTWSSVDWIDRHPGGHGPPDDMRKRFDSALTWMQVKASS